MYVKHMSESILEKVRESRKTAHSPAEIIQAIIEQVLDEREQHIVRERYGLGEKASTLDAIGKKLGITRERVRQIAKQAINKLADAKDTSDVRTLDMAVKDFLELTGGVREQEALLKEYFNDLYDEIQAAYLIFFLEHLSDTTEKAPFNKPSWQLRGAPVHLHQTLEKHICDHLEAHDEPRHINDIHEALSEHEGYMTWQQEFLKAVPHMPENIDWPRVVSAYLELSDAVSSNPFDEWGPIKSPLVKPRRMADKIYLVLKKYGKPLHFNDITERINELNFDAKKAYSPTVHNELILDKRFVLVGRGIYALTEWGFEKGTVADVLAKILEREEKALTREELLDHVLKERKVKEGTVLLALTDKERFVKNADGTYELVIRNL